MIKYFIAIAACVGITSAAALAMPGDGPSTKPYTAPKVTSPKALKCKRGETVKRVKIGGTYKNTCVKLNSQIVPDAELYQQARALADAGEYEWALDHLRAISDQKNADVLTYTGYANRKAGRVETGIAYYHQALAIDPDHVEAREYLGEAYVLTGFKDKALQQLQEIEKRCPAPCEAYDTLKSFIANN